jgi:ActR/RegA family two-component response regulator
VLIAGDRPLFCRTLAEALKSRGMEVAGEEPSVVALTKERKPNVVVVDLEVGATGLLTAIDEKSEGKDR